MTRRKLSPARLVPPGRILRRELDARGWTQKEFSEMIELSEKAVSAIVNGKKQIMPETALKFAAALGGTPQFWLNLEANYRLHLAEREVDEAVLEAIRSRSAVRTAEDSSSLELSNEENVAQHKATTLDLPVDSSLEASLVQAAQRAGASLEDFVAQVLQEKLYSGSLTSDVPRPHWPHLSDAAWRAMVAAGLEVEAKEVNERLFARWLEHALGQVDASLRSGYIRDAEHHLRDCQRALDLPSRISPIMATFSQTVQMFVEQLEQVARLREGIIEQQSIRALISSQIQRSGQRSRSHRPREVISGHDLQQWLEMTQKEINYSAERED